MRERLREMLEELRERRPLIHCITNPISINDCANLVLAAGGRPIMAEHPREVEEITATAAALALNLGNITDVRMASMLRAAKAARAHRVPVIVDAVGVGCSRLRRDYVHTLLAEGATVLKGNVAELCCLWQGESGMSGVDAPEGSGLTGGELAALRGLSRQTGAVVLASGAVDAVVSPSGKLLRLSNGSPMMGRLTGTGCMLNVLTACFLAVGSGEEAAVAAAAMLGICGERAARAARGPGSLRTQLLDEAYCLTPEELGREARIQQDDEKGGGEQ